MGLLDIFGKLTGVSNSGRADKNMPSSPPKKQHSKAYFAFCDKYDDAAQNKIEKINDMEDEFDNPDKTVSNYNKMLTKYEDLKTWCLEKEGGAEYYEEFVAPEANTCKKALDDFMQNDYDDAKFAFQNSSAVEKKMDKIYDMDVEFLDPDKAVRNYDAMLSKFEELRQWCDERHGTKYFNEEILPDFEEMKKRAADFKANEYESAKQKFGIIRNTQEEIIAAMKDAPAKKTDLEKMFSGDANYKAALKDLIDGGTVIQGKEGNRIVYSVK